MRIREIVELHSLKGIEKDLLTPRILCIRRNKRELYGLECKYCKLDKALKLKKERDNAD